MSFRIAAKLVATSMVMPFDCRILCRQPSHCSSRSRSKSPLFRKAAKKCLTDKRWLCKSHMVSTASPQRKTADITAISMASVSKQTRTIWRCAYRSLWMKIVPYVYVNVQFHACWWNECEYNGDCYQPQDSPLTERPESRCKELRSLPTTKKKRSQSTKFENWCENVFKNCLRNPQKITKSIENDKKNS